MAKNDYSQSRCCVCGKVRLVYSYSFDSQYSVFACSGCGSAQLDPPPSIEILQSAYDTDYYGESEKKFSFYFAALFELSKKFQSRFLPKRYGKTCKLLDIGAGDGTFARVAKDLGFQVFATELAGPAAERLHKQGGITVEIGEFSKETFCGVKFDIITLWHVLEHLDSVEQLVSISDRLQDNGQLLIAVPNIESWQARIFKQNWFHWDPPRHIFLPTQRGVSAVMKKQGLALIGTYNFFFQYNVFGWQQSLLNSFGFPRDQMYSTLKARRVKSNQAVQFAIYFYLLFSLLPATLLAIFEAIFGKGGTVLWKFRREQ